jgi:hypothetical protein
MDDERFEADLQAALRHRAIAADSLMDADAILDAVEKSRHRRMRPMLGLLAIPLLLGAIVGVSALANWAHTVPALSVSGGALAAQSCGSGAWPSTPVNCSAAEAAVSWGSASIERTRVWLTSLSAVKAAFNPPQQVNEPPPSTAVWVFVYDGRWTCCIVGQPDGTVSGPSDHSRWLYVVDAVEQGHGFINIVDWSGRPVPDQMPPP